MTLARTLWGTIALSCLVGAIALAIWGIPAPTTQIEKAIPNEKLLQ